MCPQVLKWVEEAIQASKVHLLSTDHDDGAEHTWPVPFDPSLKEVTISLSGPAPGIEVRDPAGRSPGEGGRQEGDVLPPGELSGQDKWEAVGTGITKPWAENLNGKAMSCKALIQHQVHLLCSPPGLALPLVLGGFSRLPWL